MKKFQYGVWYPIKDYYENINDLDWAIVQFKETKTGFLPLPYRAEYHQRDKIWFTDTDADRYLCELCEPIAFMLWQPIEEVFKKDKPLEVIKEKPFESASCINYLTINKNNSNMLDYKHYCMTIRECDRVNEDEFNLLKEAIE